MLSRSAAAVTAHSRRAAAMRRLRRRTLDAHRTIDFGDHGFALRDAGDATDTTGHHGDPVMEPPTG